MRASPTALDRSPPVRPPLAALLLFPLMAVVTLACTFNAVAWIGRVYPGFFLWENNFTPAIGVTRAPAVEAGLRYHSRLVAVDGTPVADRSAVERLVGARPVGTAFRYTLEKDGETYDIHLPSTRLAPDVFLLTLGNYLGNALVLLGLAVAVIFLEPASRGARAFFLFCANWGLYLATSTDIVGPSWFQPLYFFLVTLCPATSLQLVLDFPAMPARLTRLRAALPLLYLAAPLLGAGSVVAFHWSFSTLLVLDRVTHLAMACVGAAVLVIMGIALRRPPSPVARERLRIMLLGLGGAFLVPVLAVTAVYTTRASVPFNYLTLGLACFPAAAAYAIARHDLFGVDRLIRRTVAYVAVSVALGLTYAALLAYVHYVVMPERPVSAPIHILITMLLVVLFSPLRIRIQALVDLLYFRAPYDYRRTVAAASRALTSLLDLDEIVSRLVQIITEQMQVTHARVWLRDPASGAVRCEGGAGPEVAGDGPLMTFLGAQPGRVLYVGLGASEGRVPRRAVAALEAVGAALAVPMLFEQSVVGFLALGEKRSGHLYSTDDIQLLTTLANQAAVAIQNARAYRALAEANRELHEARDQLVEAERLVAIGELSAAVAHGIRNPVAGIKMAADLAVRQARPDDPLRESFVDILTEADALESRIRDLLDFARPFVPHYAPGDLNEVVRGTLHLLRRQLAEREITISTVLPPALPPHEFDHAQIEQVCLALVTNAIEAMSAGGTLTVAVSSDGGPAEGEIELRVHDAGHGIPPDELGKVFRLFFTKKARGTGVGLAIVKRIVEAHRGRIHVQSRAGEGTEFRVVLPTHSAHARPAPGAAAPPADGGLSRSGARRSRSR